MLLWLRELVYLTKLGCLMALYPGTVVPHGELDPERANIVLVYGKGGTPTILLPLKEQLENAGFNVLVPDIGRGEGDIDALAVRLDALLQARFSALVKLHGKTPSDIERNLVLFGHSMGGLIIFAAQRKNPDLLFFKVVTAGTPYYGSPLAYFFTDEASMQLRPRSNWLHELRADIEKHPRKLFQIRARADEIVPAYSSILPGHPYEVADIIGHTALLFDLDPNMLKKQFDFLVVKPRQTADSPMRARAHSECRISNRLGQSP